MGTGKGLLDSLVAEGGFKLGDIGVVIEIRRARSYKNSNNFCFTLNFF